MTDDIPYRSTLLYHGAKLTNGDRDAEYGPPAENMMDIAWLWMTYLNGKYKHQQHMLSGEDVAHMMALMKIARTYQQSAKPDTYIDAATYIAIAGEIRATSGALVGGGNDEQDQ